MLAGEAMTGMRRGAAGQQLRKVAPWCKARLTRMLPQPATHGSELESNNKLCCVT